jgi:hypothetical protein
MFECSIYRITMSRLFTDEVALVDVEFHCGCSVGWRIDGEISWIRKCDAFGCPVKAQRAERRVYAV